MKKLIWLVGLSGLAFGLVATSACGPIDEDDLDAGEMADTPTDECEENSDCDEAEGEVCNTEVDPNECVSTEPEPEYTFVQIRDQGAERHDEDTCDAEDPGSDLFAAELLDSEGSNLGWGAHIASNLEGANNIYTDVDTVFDGTAPDLADFSREGDDETNQCPAPGGDDNSKFRSDTIVSLGCNGAIVLAFENDEGEDATLEAGQQLNIHEYGAQCCATEGACPAEYVTATVCSAESEDDIIGQGTDDNGNFPTCDNAEVVSGSGLASGTIGESALPTDEEGN